VRNRYLAALSTYERPQTWPALLLPAAFSGLCVLRYRDEPSVSPFLFMNFVVGANLASHLRFVLCSPSGRLTPGVREAHFVVASGWVTIIAIIIPFVCSLLRFGIFGPHLSLIALVYATTAIGFVVAAPIGFVIPAAGSGVSGGSGVAWVALFLLILAMLFHEQLESVLTPPLAISESLFLLAFSTVLMGVGAKWITKFNGETTLSPEQRLLRLAGRWTALGLRGAWLLGRRIAAGFSVGFGRDESSDKARDVERRLEPFLPARNLRSLGGANPGPGESLWRRARHWNAAWRFAWTPVVFGVLFGGMLLSSFTKPSPEWPIWMMFVPYIPLAGLVPASHFWQKQNRVRFAGEFLRPYSRKQLVQAVGLVVGGSVALFLLLVVSIPLVGFWVRTGHWPSPKIVWSFVAVVAWAPLLFAAGNSNVGSFDSTLNVGLCLFLYGVFILIGVSEQDSILGWPLAWFCGIVAAVGFLALIYAYRTWLNNEVG
jgi:hypothetical protein